MSSGQPAAREAVSSGIRPSGEWRLGKRRLTMFRWVCAVALVLVGCSSRERADNPEGAVHLFIAAARSGDRAAVYQRLGPQTRKRIELLLSTSRHQSGHLITKPEDFFSVGWAPPAWEPAGTRTVRRDPESAEVEVYSAAGDRHSLTLVHEDNEWKIELLGG